MVIACYPAALPVLTSAIAPHVIKEILKVLLVFYDFWNDAAGENTPPETCAQLPPPASPRFDMEPPARLFESAFGRVETKVAEPRQYFRAPLPPGP